MNYDEAAKLYAEIFNTLITESNTDDPNTKILHAALGSLVFSNLSIMTEFLRIRLLVQQHLTENNGLWDFGLQE